MSMRTKVNYFIAAGFIAIASMLVSCSEDEIDPVNNETGTFTDARDGKTYKTVEIGNQVWMAENLNFATTSGSCVYDNNPANAEIYGRLYNWETAQDACPTGWHLPTDEEWTILTEYLGGEQVAAGKMKEEGNIHWDAPNTGATNESGFTALGAGDSIDPDFYDGMGIIASFWSATEKTSHYAYVRNLFNNSASINRHDRHKDFSLSVRCIKD